MNIYRKLNKALDLSTTLYSGTGRYSHHHYYHTITTITPSQLSHHHYYHTITTITSLLSHHHYCHTITTVTPSLLSHHHNYHTITTINITTVTPHYYQHHYCHPTITTVTPSLLSHHHYCHTITTVTLSLLSTSLLSHHHYYHTITTVTPSQLSPSLLSPSLLSPSLLSPSLLSHHHNYHHHYYHHHYYHTITTITPSLLLQWSHGNYYRLLSILSDEDRNTFNFDLKTIDWDTYIDSFCMGTKKYMLKEDVANLPAARRQIRRSVCAYTCTSRTQSNYFPQIAQYSLHVQYLHVPIGDQTGLPAVQHSQRDVDQLHERVPHLALQVGSASTPPLLVWPRPSQLLEWIATDIL